MNNISEQEREYLLFIFLPVVGRTLMKEVLNTYLEAERILLGKEKVRVIGCKCELPELKDNTERLFNQWYKKYENEHGF